jgi:cadmium resistance protein CadD (predicted permease)
MEPFFSALGLAIVVFTLTNVDDLLILTAFFMDRSIPTTATVIGQFLGMGCLTALSVMGALTAISLPEGWTRWLGLIPLALGLHRAFALRNHRWKIKSDLATRASAPGDRKKNQVALVAVVTIANGADNLAATIPLFATQLSFMWLFLIVFTLMTSIWCWTSFSLIRHPGLASRIGTCGHLIPPVILILIGLRLLKG